MVSVVYEADEKELDLILTKLDDLPNVLEEIVEETMDSIGFLVSNARREYIQKGFRDTSINTLTSGFYKRYSNVRGLGNSSNPWFANGREAAGLGDTPFYFMGKYSNFMVRKNSILFGFSNAKKEPKVFNPVLQKISKHMQAGYKIPVTPEMRRAIALSKDRGGIALKGTTTHIEVKARPLKPAYDKVKSKIPDVFITNAQRRFRKRFLK